jgi:hypothetical protein
MGFREKNGSALNSPVKFTCYNSVRINHSNIRVSRPSSSKFLLSLAVSPTLYCPQHSALFTPDPPTIFMGRFRIYLGYLETTVTRLIKSEPKLVASCLLVLPFNPKKVKDLKVSL